MKKIGTLILLIFHLSLNPVEAQDLSVLGGIDFFKGTLKEALALAKKENKPVFLDVYAIWCGPCSLLKKKTFVNDKVAAYYNDHFINISLDGEKGDGAAIAQLIGISAYPTLLYLNANGKVFLYAIGYQSPKQFIKTGKKAMEVYVKPV